MARAIQLARKGLYTTDPNPRVGCVLVKDGRIIGEGWHKRAGFAHAEVEALNDVANANEDSSGATAYVTLEPCSHHGRTPPCCEALVRAGIKRVVVALQDPNPKVSGQGFAYLKAAGIEVNFGVLEEAARILYRGFLSRMTKNRPFVRSKLAMSLDGRTAMSSGESQWITSPEARADVHRLRAESSAILTGINTILKDDPYLTARIDKEVEVVQPVRVILDSTLRISTTANVASIAERVFILTLSKDEAKKETLQKVGFEVYNLPEKQGRLDLVEVMKFLATQEINEVLVEAGAVLNGALLSKNMVDEWIIYMAPYILGDEGLGMFTLPGLQKLVDKKKIKFQDVRHVGQDIKLTLVLGK